MSNRCHHVTYNDRRCAEYGSLWASEAIFLIDRAKILDVREHPRLHAELHSPSNNCCDDLTEEHRAMRDLHIVTELEVARELKCLSHGVMAPGLEQHHGNRAARKRISDNQLGDDIKPYFLGRNGPNHTNGNSVDKRCVRI